MFYAEVRRDEVFLILRFSEAPRKHLTENMFSYKNPLKKRALWERICMRL